MEVRKDLESAPVPDIVFDITKVHFQFHRRSLAIICIPFGSPRGKRTFTKALNSDHMGCYFQLASHFCTQEGPYRCGTGTLVMVLNTLLVDPEHVWRDNWRWYDEAMLKGCSLTKIDQGGMSMDEFASIAQKNQLTVNVTRVTEKSSIDVFRLLVKKVTKREDVIMVCSFSRACLEQTGDGHFSPIGGYEPEEDLVLILDVARYKYPPYWISVTKLWMAMMEIDEVTGKSRGFLLLQKKEMCVPPMSLAMDKNNVTCYAKGLGRFVSDIHRWRLENDNILNKHILEAMVRRCPEAIPKRDVDVRSWLSFNMIDSGKDNNIELIGRARIILAEIEDSEIYKWIDFLFVERNHVIRRLRKPLPDSLYSVLTQKHALALIVMAMGYEQHMCVEEDLNGVVFARIARRRLDFCSNEVQEQVKLLRSQLFSSFLRNSKNNPDH